MTMSRDNQSRVTVTTKLTAVSSKPSGSGKIHELTGLDHAMGYHTVYVIFYYKENMFGSLVLDPMRESLSELLTLYTPVTGRLARGGDDGNWAVHCNDAGVRTTRTKVGATLDQWLKSADSLEERDLAAIDDHIPLEPHIWSQFRLQINEFEGGGVAIGVSFTHLSADPTSAVLLLKAWADTHRGEAVPQPLFTRPSGGSKDGKKLLKVEAQPANYYASKSKAPPSPVKMASATFKFSHATISQCLSEIKESCPDATPFDILAALFWKRVVHIKGLKNKQNHSLSICTDIRKLFHSPLSHRYFGNALHFSRLSIDPEEMDRYGLGHVAGLLHCHVRRLIEEEDEVWSAVEWLESQKEKGGKYAPAFEMYGPKLTCVSMEHMVDGSESLMYATKFDKESKPVHVSCNIGKAEGEGLIVVMPSNEGGLSRNVMVMMPEKEVAEICEDQAILSLQPTLLLNGRQ